VVRVLGYRFGGPGSIPGTTRKKKVVGLERGPLSLVSTTEEQLRRKSSGSCLENREYGRRDPSRWPRGTLYAQKLAITSPSGRSVGIVRLRTQIMEFFFISSLVDSPISILRSEENTSHRYNENIFWSITQAHNNNNNNKHISLVQKVTWDNIL
jgi:hypothetical protein